MKRRARAIATSLAVIWLSMELRHLFERVEALEETLDFHQELHEHPEFIVVRTAQEGPQDAAGGLEGAPGS